MIQSFKVSFFDGKSSKEKPLTLKASKEFIFFEENEWKFPIEEVEITKKISGVSQTLTLPHGGICILNAHETLSFKKNRVLFLETKLRYAFLALLIMVGFGYFLVTYGSAWGAKVLAQNLPENILHELSQKSLSYLEDEYLETSKLKAQTREHLEKKFEKIAPESLHVKLHFYSSPKFGANAFALPSGDIILLDELVKLDKDEELLGVVGVLAHEMGHVQEKHSLRGIIRASIAGVVVAYFFGDFSSILTTLSAGLMTFSYSREFEREADDIAIKIMKKNGYSIKPLANLFEDISKQNTFLKSEILSTHPLFKERIEKLKNHSK